MPGQHMTSQQVELYMGSRQQGYSQKVSSAKTGMSERSGRKLERGGACPKTERHWRTRPAPFVEVWQSELVPLLESQPLLSALTLMEYLQERYPVASSCKLIPPSKRKLIPQC